MGLALAWGCSKQGEGERCDVQNGDLDCDTGLLCRGGASLNIPVPGAALCCPPQGQPAVEACRTSTPLPPEPDAGSVTPPTPTPTPDAGAQTPEPSVPDAGDGGT